MAAHKSIEYEFLTVVGWDAMLTDKNELTFFEGNYGIFRTPRILFLSI